MARRTSRFLATKVPLKWTLFSVSFNLFAHCSVSRSPLFVSLLILFYSLLFIRCCFSFHLLSLIRSLFIKKKCFFFRCMDFSFFFICLSLSATLIRFFSCCAVCFPDSVLFFSLLFCCCCCFCLFISLFIIWWELKFEGFYFFFKKSTKQNQNVEIDNCGPFLFAFIVVLCFISFACHDHQHFTMIFALSNSLTTLDLQKNAGKYSLLGVSYFNKNGKKEDLCLMAMASQAVITVCCIYQLKCSHCSVFAHSRE